MAHEPKEVKAWQTTDEEIFIDRKLAVEHQSEIDTRVALKNFFSNNNICWESFTAEELIDFIVIWRYKLKELLNDQCVKYTYGFDPNNNWKKVIPGVYSGDPNFDPENEK